MRLISGIFKHLAEILTFQHSGKGLPKGKPVVHAIALVTLLIQLAFSVTSEASPLMAVTQFCVFYAVLSYLLPTELSFVAIVTIMAMDVLGGLLGLVVVETEGAISSGHTILVIWQLTALLITFHRFHQVSKKK